MNGSRKRPNTEQDKSIDVYAYAITMYECITRNNAWPGMKAPEIFQNVIVGRRPEIPEDTINEFSSSCPQLLETIQRSWSHQAHERPSFMEIRNALIQDISRLG